MTLQELSKTIGLSTATITRALNDDNSVIASTKEKVLEAVKTYGYVPRNRRTTIKEKNSDMVMIITGSLYNPVHLNLVMGIEAELSKVGKHTVTVQTDYKEELQDIYLKYAKEAGFSCIMILNAVENPNLINFISHPNNPKVIFVNRKPKTVEVDSITLDNYRCGYLAGKKLIENGHSKIIVISGPKDSTVCNERISGFAEAMAESGLPFNESSVIHGNRTYEYGLSIGHNIIEMEALERPTALYCVSGTMAGGFLDAINQGGLQVPLDMSLISNDSPSNIYAQKLSITSIEVDFFSMGSVAGKRYLEILSQKNSISKQILFIPTIHERASVRHLAI